MRLVVRPSLLDGQVAAPKSKSLMQRFIAAATLANGTTIIREPAENDDSLHGIYCARALGADIDFENDDLHLTGNLNWPEAPLNVGESGLGMRLYIPIASLFDKGVKVIGEGSLRARPIDAFEDILPALGVNFRSRGGRLPVTVQGPLIGGEATIDGSVSSQFLSGLLMALPLAKHDSTIQVDNLKSIPYVDMTLEVLRSFGIFIQHQDYKVFHIRGNQKYSPADVTVEGDWSGGAALLVAGAIASKTGIKVAGLRGEYTQADKAITGALLFAGAKLMQHPDGLQVTAGKLRGFSFDATDCPDLFPVLAALATAGDKPTTLTGIHRLTHKESNRAITIRDEFAKAGIKVELIDDNMIIHPGVPQSAVLDSHHDHRIAMAAALLGLRGGPIAIDNAEAIAKSYPTFFDDLELLGADIRKK